MLWVWRRDKWTRCMWNVIKRRGRICPNSNIETVKCWMTWIMNIRARVSVNTDRSRVGSWRVNRVELTVLCRIRIDNFLGLCEALSVRSFSCDREPFCADSHLVVNARVGKYDRFCADSHLVADARTARSRSRVSCHSLQRALNDLLINVWWQHVWIMILLNLYNL